MSKQKPKDRKKVVKALKCWAIKLKDCKFDWGNFDLKMTKTQAKRDLEKSPIKEQLEIIKVEITYKT